MPRKLPSLRERPRQRRIPDFEYDNVVNENVANEDNDENPNEQGADIAEEPVEMDPIEQERNYESGWIFDNK